jgi:hypothetical protein
MDIEANRGSFLEQLLENYELVRMALTFLKPKPV